MPTTKKDSRNLSARQRARLATEENQRKLKTRQKALARVFSALDARDDATVAAGHALAELKQLGGTNTTIAEEIGLDTRDVSALLRHAAHATAPNTNTDAGDDRDTDPTHPEPDTNDHDE